MAYDDRSDGMVNPQAKREPESPPEIIKEIVDLLESKQSIESRISYLREQYQNYMRAMEEAYHTTFRPEPGDAEMPMDGPGFGKPRFGF